jgi:hypothetical protein
MTLIRIGNHVFNTDYIVRVRLNDSNSFSDNCVTLLVDEGGGSLNGDANGFTGQWGLQAYSFYNEQANQLRGFFTSPDYVLDLTVTEPAGVE